MGKPDSTQSDKTNEHTRGRLTQKTLKFKHLCEKERCMGKPETPPKSQEKRTHKRKTHTQYMNNVS